MTKVTNRDVTSCFCYSQQVCIDEYTGGYERMGKIEFFEFFIRIAYRYFEGKRESAETMVSDLIKLLLN